MRPGDMLDARVNEALADCLGRLDWGETIEECLDRYPAIAEKLTPLLGMATQAQAVAAAIVPSPEAQRAGLGRITDAWAAQEARRRRGRWGALRRSWALAAIAALAVVFGGWTTAAAAQDSVPGDALYPVKQTQERVMLVMVLTRSGKADLHVQLAEARAMETAKLTSRGGDPVAVDETTTRLNEHMSRAVALMGGRLSTDPAGPSGGVRLRGPWRGQHGPPPGGDFSRPLSVEELPPQFRPDSRFVRPWHGSESKQRAAMQERFYQQFLRFQDMRRELSGEMRAPHGARMEEAITRSENLLLEAFLLMRELEDVQNPPE